MHLRYEQVDSNTFTILNVLVYLVDFFTQIEELLHYCNIYLCTLYLYGISSLTIDTNFTTCCKSMARRLQQRQDCIFKQDLLVLGFLSVKHSGNQ